MHWQLGQGTRTALTASLPFCKPLPRHCTVMPTFPLHSWQTKSRLSSSWVMCLGSHRVQGVGENQAVVSFSIFDLKRSRWTLQIQNRAIQNRKSLPAPLGSVLGARLLPVRDALGIEHAADDVVPHTGEVADAAAPHQDNRVFLKVMALTGDV